MYALALSEFYGFARLGFKPSDISLTEQELQQKYVVRVPEFLSGDTMVEVKRVHLHGKWNNENIVRKACEKANKIFVDQEKVRLFYLCYVLPQSLSLQDVQKLQKNIKCCTSSFIHLMHVPKVVIMFCKAPDVCFQF
jgi:hypothetical protein